MNRGDLSTGIALAVVGFLFGFIVMTLHANLSPEQWALTVDYAFAFLRVLAGVALVFGLRAVYRFAVRYYKRHPERVDS